MIRSFLLRLLAWFFLVTLPFPVLAAGACSSHMNKVVLNEYANQLNYAEIRLLSSGYSVAGWKIRVYKNSSTYAQGTLPGSGTNSCGNYQVAAFSSSDTPIEADVVLLDDNDDVVDILRVRNSSTVNSFYPMPSPACSYVGSKTDLTNVAAGQKGIDRSPDGYGQWRQTPGTGSGSYTTRCGPNAPNATTADLTATKVIKSGSPSSIYVGETTTYTLTVKNTGPNTASVVTIQETLPAGLSFVSNSTPSAGSFDAVNKIWLISSLAVNGTATMDITVKGETVGSWTNSITASSDNTKSTGGSNAVTATAPPVTVVSSLSGFGACESAATCSASSRLYTKLVGTDYTIKLAALQSDGSIATSFGGTVEVALLANAEPTAKNATTKCPASQTATISLGSKIFSSGVVSVTVPNASNISAYRDVAVQITCASGTCLPSSAVTWCTPDAFAIRPASFSAAASGSVATVATPSASESQKFSAGGSFTLTASAAAGYSGATLTLDSTKVLDHNGVQQGSRLKRSSDGTLIASADLVWSAGAGSAAVRYDEVGFFKLASDWARDSSFTSVDQDASTPANSDCVYGSSANTVDGSGKYGCDIGMPSEVGYFGRFYPAYFETTPSNANQCTTSASGVTISPGFTYAGQSFPVTVTAYAGDIGAAHGVTTKNYKGDYSRSVMITNAGSATDLSGNTLLASDFADGVGIAGAVAYTPASPVVPTALALRAAEVSGSDGVSSSGHGEASVNIRSGRLRLSNVYGSELLPLSMPVTTEYFGSNSLWLTNTLDGCTDPAVPTKAPTAFASTVADPALLSSGVSAISIGAPGTGITGTLKLTISAPAYLKYKWNSSAVAKDPEGAATFGIFKGNKRLIYRRELY